MRKKLAYSGFRRVRMHEPLRWARGVPDPLARLGFCQQDREDRPCVRTPLFDLRKMAKEKRNSVLYGPAHARYYIS